MNSAHLESQLADFDPIRRREALEQLAAGLAGAALPETKPNLLNLHCHTFFSYNGYGYSPSEFAWLARKQGVAFVGIVDFDVLDGVDEFLDACRLLGVRGCAGMETRVFIPEFADVEINSPGEPGISYHMGAGFVSSKVADTAYTDGLKQAAQDRNRQILERVNPYLAPVVLDFEDDVLSLTPSGNPTERHLCQAYEEKSRELFADPSALAAFWAEKLGLDPAKARQMLDDSPALQGLIRAKTMKRGGVGYVQPEGDAFPDMAAFNRFVSSAGAIPTCTWLDGTSPGEKVMEQLLDLEMAAGVAALNIIPDRNWNIADPDVKKMKVDNLYHVVDLARGRALPIVVGTEMNAPGNKFVDDFDAPEMAPLVPEFVKGAEILYAHTRLQAAAGMGYLSDWAKGAFNTTDAKNDFFAEVGRRLGPNDTLPTGCLNADALPPHILAALK